MIYSLDRKINESEMLGKEVEKFLSEGGVIQKLSLGHTAYADRSKATKRQREMFSKNKESK